MTETRPQEHPQMFHAFYTDSKSTASTPLLNTVSIVPTFDRATEEYVIFWDEILKVFSNAVYIRNGTMAVPFLVDKNSEL